jgi:hypothetical protein
MSGHIKSALHHWWPKSLSNFWVGDDDCVTRITPQGKELRSPPAQFGGITNGHTVRIGDPWDFSFESQFDDIDSRIPNLTTDLLSFEAKTSDALTQINERLTAHVVEKDFVDQIGLTLASLITRSPRNRNTMAVTTEYYQKRMGFSDLKADKNLINMNISNKLKVIGRNFNGGKYIVAYTDEQEFVFGDGFYTNMAHESSVGHRKTVVPITPLMAVIYTRPSHYFTTPNFITIRLAKQEVLLFNELIQIYSRDQLFYRSQKPILSDAFRRQEFLQYQYHNVPWLDTLIKKLHTFRG